MKNLLINLLLLCIAVTSANAAPSDRAKEIEKEGMTIARELCVDRYECNVLIESYDQAVKDPDPSGRYITFTALAVYIEQTLKSKLPENNATKARLTRMHQLFEERLGLE